MPKTRSEHSGGYPAAIDDLGGPISYMALERGAAVFSSDGVHLGRVVSVERDLSTDIFDGIVFAAEVSFSGRRFVDAPEVGEIYERGVILRIDATAAAELPQRRRFA